MKLAPDSPPRLLTNVNKKMVFFNEGFPKHIAKSQIRYVYVDVRGQCW